MAKRKKEYVITFKVIATSPEKAMDALDELLSHGGQADNVSEHTETFGNVSWCDEDIRDALKLARYWPDCARDQIHGYTCMVLVLLSPYGPHHG